jgi:hypothetical protein
MRLRRGRVAQLPPASVETASSIPPPIPRTLAHLKNAWPFAMICFVVGLIAAVIVNKRSHQAGVTNQTQLRTDANTLRRLEAVRVGFVSNKARSAKAKPPFPRSLHNMEHHLRNQGDSSSMWPVKWRGIVDESPRKPDCSVVEDLSPTQSEPAPAIPEKTDWHAQAPSFVTVPVCASPPVQMAYPVCSTVQPPKLPAWFWERGPGGLGDLKPQIAVKNAEPAAEPAPSASRMERLRGVLQEVGIANLHRNHAPLPLDEQGFPGRHAASMQPSAAAPGNEAAEPASTLVTDRPVIVSPREFVPVKEPKRTPDDAASANRDDEIRILPSRRGQYGSR